MLFSQSASNNRDGSGRTVVGAQRGSFQALDGPTHPEPSRPLVGRLLDLHPLQRHVVDGTFLDFLPPVLHRALEAKEKESFNVENFHRRGVWGFQRRNLLILFKLVQKHESAVVGKKAEVEPRYENTPVKGH